MKAVRGAVAKSVTLVHAIEKVMVIADPVFPSCSSQLDSLTVDFLPVDVPIRMGEFRLVCCACQTFNPLESFSASFDNFIPGKDILPVSSFGSNQELSRVRTRHI